MPVMQGAVGQPSGNKVSDNFNPALRQGNQGEQIISELHGRYYEAAYRKNRFIAYAAAQTLTAAGTGMTGLQLSNNSTTVNAVLDKINVLVSVTSASMTGIALAFVAQPTAPTGQTAATKVTNGFLGQPAPLVTALNAGTFVTFSGGVFLTLMHNTAAIATTGEDSIQIDLEGTVIVPPGYAVGLVALGAASAASAVSATIQWEEVPI